jgi:hypothetical protein
MPYGFDDDFANTHEFALNPKCLDESHLWLMRCPMICLFAVEWHLPHRVMSQFNLYQTCPPEWVDTGIHLHG